MVGCFFRVAERERLSGTRLTAALFGVAGIAEGFIERRSYRLDPPSPSSSLTPSSFQVVGVLEKLSELEETVRRGCDYWCMIDFIRESRGFTLLTESRGSPFDFANCAINISQSRLHRANSGSLISKQLILFQET